MKDDLLTAHSRNGELTHRVLRIQATATPEEAQRRRTLVITGLSSALVWCQTVDMEIGCPKTKVMVFKGSALSREPIWMCRGGSTRGCYNV